MSAPLTSDQQAQMDSLLKAFAEENSESVDAVKQDPTATPDVVVPPVTPVGDVPDSAPSSPAPAVDAPAEVAAPEVAEAPEDGPVESLLERLRLGRTAAQVAVVADWLKEHGLSLP